MADRDVLTRAGVAVALNASQNDQNMNSFAGTVDEQLGATYTVVYTDQNKTIQLNNASMTCTVDAIATIAAAMDTDDWKVTLININAANATVDRSSTDTFDGATSITLRQYEAVTLQTNAGGTAWNVLTEKSSLIDLTAGTISGLASPLAVGDGGTGATTIADRGVVVGRATSAIEATAVTTDGLPLLAQGAATNPEFQSTDNMLVATGTWTPVLTDGAFDVASYATQQGQYFKIGRVVFIQFDITTTSKVGLSGALAIKGLPFTSANFTQSCAMGLIGNMVATDVSYMSGQTVNNTQIGLSHYEEAAATSVNTTDADIANNFTVRATFWYFTA